MGMLYIRGKTGWVQYYENGKKIRESAKTQKKMVAKKLLEQREGDIASGKTPGFYFDKVTYDQLADALEKDYKLNGRKSLKMLKEKRRLSLDPFFGGMRVVKINSPLINGYIDQRKTEGLANASINMELSYLRRMLNYGAEQTPPMVDKVLKFKLLKMVPRKGFFEAHEFIALRDEVPEYLKGLITFAYKSGWRFDEISSLSW